MLKCFSHDCFFNSFIYHIHIPFEYINTNRFKKLYSWNIKVVLTQINLSNYRAKLAIATKEVSFYFCDHTYLYHTYLPIHFFLYLLCIKS